MNKLVDIAIVGSGPMGIALGIEDQKEGLTHIILEKGSLVNSIYHFPKNMTFFSTSEKLEIGEVPFMSIRDKPSRDEALEYYRRVVEKWNLNIHTYEEVKDIKKVDQLFSITTIKASYHAKHVVIATGFYGNPNRLHVPGEELEKVSHYFDDAHPYIHQKVAVIGAGNSATQVALELNQKGADVTMIVRGSEIKPTVKYWIKPNIENRIQEGAIQAYFDAEVKEIKDKEIIIEQEGKTYHIPNDFVFAMIGYQPDYQFLSKIGIACQDEKKIPIYDGINHQTTINNLYIAGVVCGGLQTNTYFIENSMEHAEKILRAIIHHN